ncbi:hypothetical protein R2601_02768 [Salipiger bermudensis HTCC2601]|uniref:Uncharacterized protein n=1 Tax=Salipiger bermudensis (strain DSM 26914 / JCM 13377 / KCTC 12554 / HTCC2601) TaxID=314265 RepID=Q0FWU2_SALBH|nr:hypothetical protein R2601_02768 [Salipiger bermudensis HTCC2601]
MPLKNSVETPPISITLKAKARTSPGSTLIQTIIASAASASSTMIPAPPTTARRHFSGKAAEAEAST